MEEVWGELAEKRFAEFILGKSLSVSWKDIKKKITEAIK